MAGREAPVHAHPPKQSNDACSTRSPHVPTPAGRSPGAAVQLAAVHRTLRRGPLLQRRAAGAAAGAQPAAPQAASANRTGLPDRLKAGVETLSGVSMDGVKVHYNSSKPGQLDALAYAQGSDIHLAPGQERHLPHEAWHVVQQQQGRVRATGQMKGGVPVNDDAGLEREADIMGAKAAAGGGQRARTAGRASAHGDRPSAGSTVQAYSIRREPKRGTLYSVSDNAEVITGMDTPNHDLYIDQPGKIAAIANAAKQSVLAFEEGSKISLFGKVYSRVQASFKKVSFKAAKSSIFGSEERKVDLGETYYKNVAPALEAKSLAAYKTIMFQIRGSSWESSYDKIQVILKPLTSSLELFKKLVIANQAKEGYNDVVNLMDRPLIFIDILEKSIYSQSVSKQSFEKTVTDLDKKAAVLSSDFKGDEHLLETLKELMYYTIQLATFIPKGPPVDLMLVHSLNYQESMLQSIKNKDPMFYRACDVMATTVLGNKLTHQNKDQLKVYTAGRSGAFHYAAKILTAGADWVTLESFAAGERERGVLGTTEENWATNLDNSWQYMMYGSIKKRGETGHEEDNAFELYTKLRYHLKGIKEVGHFSTQARDRLTSPIPQDAFITIPGIDGQKSAALWDRFFRSGVFNEYGKVKNPDYLEKNYIALRLDPLDRPKAAAISNRLKALYGQPSSSQRFIQNSPSNEMRNVVAWIKLMKLPVDIDRLEMKLDRALGDEVDPAKVYNKGWIEMMLGMERK